MEIPTSSSGALAPRAQSGSTTPDPDDHVRAAEGFSLEPAEFPQKSIYRDYAETILVCVLFVVFSRTFVFQQSKIPTGSMMDTLLVGDYIMVNRFVYAPTSFAWEQKLLPQRAVRHGDVVVFKQPDKPEEDYIKRVIGTPGDIVELRNGFLHVNGEMIAEPYVEEEYRLNDPHRNMGPVEVQPDHYFVLGDHRDRSADSRFWGQVPRDLMKGRALLTWWSFKDGSDQVYPDLRERLRSMTIKARYFFSRTRWERCFRLIR